MSLINHGTLMCAVYALENYYKSGDYVKPFQAQEIADLVIAHAATSAAAAMAAGVLPGAASVASCGIAVTAIWSMYYRIGRYLNIKFNLDALKALSAALITNLVTQVAGILALDLALTFVPGASIIAAGVMNFAVVYVAGIMYLNMLKVLLGSGKDPSHMSPEELKQAFEHSAGNVDIKTACSEARNLFRDMRKNGRLKKDAAKAEPVK